ncbi:MAG: hypothetical protein ACE5GZ_14000, partial [Gammaproteobacteria bacterium]
VIPESVLAQESLLKSDKLMARVGEDLIDVLLAKGIIASTDLPVAAQNIIKNRKANRGKL